MAAQPPSPGRCAGPTAADLLSLALPARRAARHGYDLSGTVTFGAGPFMVTVTSTIRVLAVPQQGFGGPGAPTTITGAGRTKPHAVLAERADIAYRVISAHGLLTASFSGSAQPLCTPLDACGTTGAVSLALTRTGQRLDFSGSRIVTRRIESRQALRDLRAGRLRLDANNFAVRLGGELTGTLTGPDTAPCRDTVSESALFLNQSAAHGDYRLLLEQSGSGPGSFGPDELRTRCPGPGSTELLGSRPLGIGAVTIHDLGARRMMIVLRAAGRFRGTAYAGTRSGSIVLTLTRTHVSAGTRRPTVFGNQVLG